MIRNKPNFLFVCGKNKKRSRTAENIFRNDERFAVRSAGLSPKSEKKLSHNDLSWADIVFVMEREHKNKIDESFGHNLKCRIIVLDIPDEYEFMDAELIDVLRDGVDRQLAGIY